MKKLPIIGLFALILVLPLVYGISFTKIGTTALNASWMFSKATGCGIYYGLGWQADNINQNLDIYYFDFNTSSNTLLTTLTDIWGDGLYTDIIDGRIYISNFYNYPLNFASPNPYDRNGTYVIDTVRNTFSLYKRMPFDFFANNQVSPMIAVGDSLYFFSAPGDRVYKFNTTSNISTALADLPSDINYAGIVNAIGSKIYITSYGFYTNNTLYSYDIPTDTFTLLKNSTLIPSNAMQLSDTAIGSNIYFIGGEDPLTGDATSKIVVYSTTLNTLTLLATYTKNIAGVGVAVVGGTAYVLGGTDYDTGDVYNDIIKLVVDPTKTVACDKDLDGVADSADNLLLEDASASTLTTTNVDNLAISVGGSTDLTTATGTQQVVFNDSEGLLFEFQYNFSFSDLNLLNVTIAKETATENLSSLVITGLNLQAGQTKTVYLEAKTGTNKVCVKDAPTATINEVSGNCTGQGEVLFDNCGATTQTVNSYTCTRVSGQYKITGMNHTALRELEGPAVPVVADADGDGVDDDADNCPNTATGSIVDGTGCSIAQYCPATATYKNHGKYVSCVAKKAEEFLEKGLITEAEKDAIVSEAAKSSIGKK